MKSLKKLKCIIYSFINNNTQKFWGCKCFIQARNAAEIIFIIQF